jgi:hypothetical protein
LRKRAVLSKLAAIFLKLYLFLTGLAGMMKDPRFEPHLTKGSPATGDYPNAASRMSKRNKASRIMNKLKAGVAVAA